MIFYIHLKIEKYGCDLCFTRNKRPDGKYILAGVLMESTEWTV